MLVFKDHFNDFSNWVTAYPLAILDDTFACCTSQTVTENSVHAWRTLDGVFTSQFRLDLRVKGRGVFGGFTTAKSLADVEAGTHADLAIGIDIAGKQVCATFNGEVLASMPLIENEQNTWHMQLVSDGKVLTATYFDKDGNIRGSLRMQPPKVAFQALYIRFSSTEGQVDSFATITGVLDGYCDPAFDQRLALWLNPDPSTDWASVDERAFVVLPASYTRKQPIRLCLDNHGKGGSPENYVKDHLWKLFNERGYLVAGSHAYGNNYGHSRAIEAIIRLRNHLHQLFNLYYKAFSMGESMGGLLAYLCPLDYPDLFAAIASIYGVANLTWRYYGIDSPGLSRSEDINMAYGCTEQSFFYKTCLHNVHNRLPELVRFPLKCWHGDADKIVGLNQSRYTVDEVNTLGGNASLVVVPDAGHGHKSGIRDSSVIDFFDSIPNIALTGQDR